MRWFFLGWWLAFVVTLESSSGVHVTTCEIEKETATANSRAERTYYICGNSASFVLVVDSPGELRMREAAGHTVDISIEVVR